MKNYLHLFKSVSSLWGFLKEVSYAHQIYIYKYRIKTVMLLNIITIQINVFFLYIF